MRWRVKRRTALQVEPPDIADFVHVFAQASVDPYPISPDVCGVIEPANEPPCPRPGERLQVKVAYVLQHIVIVTGDASHDEQLVFVQDGRMPSSTLRYRPRDLWLCPVGRLEIEDYKVREVCPVLVFAAEDQKLVALVESRSMP